jgi:hypothetical protein
LSRGLGLILTYKENRGKNNVFTVLCSGNSTHVSHYTPQKKGYFIERVDENEMV